MSKCTICGAETSNGWMMMGGYTLCMKCAKDYNDFDNQPHKNGNLLQLMETMFRRGAGEDVSFEKVFKDKSGFKFFTFADMWKVPGGSK